MKRLLIPLFIALLASASQAADITQEIAAATLVKAGTSVADFTCTTTDGRAFQLAAQRGKVVLLYFFSSSAPFSLTEMRYIEKEIFQKAAARDDLVILGIARGHTREETVMLGGKQGINFPLAADADQTIYRRYFTKFVPRTLVVGKDGRVAYLASGSREFEGILALQQELEKALRRKVP